MSTTTVCHGPFIDWGVATRAIPGQTVSGDAHLVAPFTGGALIAVVDGLGHGYDATAAARVAVEILRENPEQSVISLVQRCHQALMKTRGAVMTLASFNTLDRTMRWLSVGNVAGLLMRADTKTKPAHESTMLRGGVVGFQLPILRPGMISVSPGDLLILASDGIRSGFEQSVIFTDQPQRIADRILSRHFKGTDDALVLVVRYVGTRHE